MRSMQPLTIPKAITGGADLVILTKESYEHMQRQMIELGDALKKVQKTDDEHSSGHTTLFESPEHLK